MDDLALLRFYLSERDVPCPRCGYALRDTIQPRCPECGGELRLVLTGTAPPYAFLAVVTASVFILLVRFVAVAVLLQQDGWSLHIALFGWQEYAPSIFLFALHGALLGVLLARRNGFTRLGGRWQSGAAGVLCAWAVAHSFVVMLVD